MIHMQGITQIYIRFKTSMLRSSLCDYSDAYIPVKGTIVITNTGTQESLNNRNKKVYLRIALHLLIA